MSVRACTAGGCDGDIGTTYDNTRRRYRAVRWWLFASMLRRCCGRCQSPGECRRVTCTGVCARDVLGAAESTTRYAHTHTRRPCTDVPTATDGDRMMVGRDCERAGDGEW